MGHLLGMKCVNNNFITSSNDLCEILPENTHPFFSSNEENTTVLRQNEALINDDVMLSSSSLMFPQQQMHDIIIDDDESSRDYEYDEVSSSSNYMCRWQGCYQQYDSQHSLVRHIEKSHVELKKGTFISLYYFTYFNLAFVIRRWVHVLLGELPKANQAVQRQVQAAHPHASAQRWKTQQVSRKYATCSI